jgi:hypothetical protein
MRIIFLPSFFTLLFLHFSFSWSLLKDLPIEAFWYHGNFYPVAGDAALMWSLCEKAGIHTAYNPRIIYKYRQTHQSDIKLNPQLCADCVQYARNQSKYTPLDELPIQCPTQYYRSGLVIFSYNRPLQLYALLESLQEYVTGLHTVSVLYRADNKEFENAYQQVQNKFNQITFIQQSKKPEHDFKPLLLDIINKSFNDCSYLMFATDDDIVKDYISIPDCIRALQKTHAYGFHLRLGSNVNFNFMSNHFQKLPLLVDIGEDVYAWQHCTALDYWSDWSWITTVDMTLYPKHEIINILKLKYQNPNTLENAWANLLPSLTQKVGLCFKQSKVVNIPLNRVQTTYPNNRSMGMDTRFLLDQFNAGYKMNRQPLHLLNNCSPHIDYTIEFTKR